MLDRLATLTCALLLNLSFEALVDRSSFSVQAAAVVMHHHSVPSNKSLPLLKIKPPYGPISDHQVNVVHAIKDKILRRERFFGIEVSARSESELDYSAFKLTPLFTSVVWVGDKNANFNPITEAPAIKIAKDLRNSGVVMPHITCFNMTEEKLDQFPFDTFNNVLVLRGDNVMDNQTMKYAADLVKEIRKRRKDINIAVGGYPEIHPQATSKAEDLRHLKEKVDAGADMIITQICFSADLILNFIRDCRKIGINVPILPGIFVPPNFNALNALCKITGACPPKEQMDQYTRLSKDKDAFQDYARKNAVNLIRKLLESDQDIYGVQFFTLNYFHFISSVANELFG